MSPIGAPSHDVIGLGSPHNALQLPALAPLLRGLFICQKAFPEQAGGDLRGG